MNRQQQKLIIDIVATLVLEVLPFQIGIPLGILYCILNYKFENK